MWSLALKSAKQFEVTDVPLTDEPPEGFVRTRTLGVGLCGTDMGSFNAKHTMYSHGAGGGYGKPIGHEWAGKIIAAGKGVDLSEHSLSVGDTVTVFPYKCFCGGSCPQCQVGNTHKGVANQTLGVQRPGAATEYFDAPVGDLMRTILPPDVAVLHEPLSIGMSTVKALLNVEGNQPGTKPLVIVGGGMIGLACAWAAGVLGWKRDQVLVMTRYPVQTSLAERVLNVNAIEFPSGTSMEDQVNAVKASDKIGKYGSPFVIESTGQSDGFIAAQQILAANGTLSLVGFPVETPLHQGDFVRKTASMVSSRNASRGLMRDVLRNMEAVNERLMRADRSGLERLITHRFSPPDFAVQADSVINGGGRNEKLKVLITDQDV